MEQHRPKHKDLSRAFSWPAATHRHPNTFFGNIVA